MFIRSVLIGLGSICLAAVFAPGARADIVFDSTQGVCCFSVDLHQAGPGDVLVTVTATGGANLFVNTGSPPPTNHPGFAFNLDQTITAFNIQNSQDLDTFHVGPDPTSGPDFGTFGYYFDIPGNGASAQDKGPLVFDVVLAGLTPSDFITNVSGYYFAADLLNGTSGEAGVNTDRTATVQSTVPEPTSIILLGTVLFLAATRLRARRTSNTV